MFNPYLPKIAKIISNTAVSSDTNLITLKFKSIKESQNFSFAYLQFIMVGLPGFGEAAFSLASSPNNSENFAIAVRQAGVLSEKLRSLKKGEELTVRGPFGNGLNEELSGQKVLLVAGGCGFIPFRPIIDDFIKNKLLMADLKIFYGCKNLNTLLFKDEHASWKEKAKVQIILESPDERWTGQQGLITQLFDQQKIDPQTKVVLIGPPIMYKFVIKKLQEQKIPEQNIFLSLERKMYCGMGVCQHCAIGPYYVCKDGPVFRYDLIKDVWEAI